MSANVADMSVTVTFGEPGEAWCLTCEEIRPHRVTKVSRHDLDEGVWRWVRACVCEVCERLISDCGECGEWVETDDMCTSPSDEYLCAGCWDGSCTICDRCHETCWQEDTRSVDGDSWCEYCAERYANWCEGCDTYHYEECDHGAIRSYSYTPGNLTFHGTGPAFMGLELETEWEDGDMHDAARDMSHKFGDSLYCKQDGSLDCGMELVSHPRSLESWQSWSQFGELLESLRGAGARSWNPGTCGIHVHLSRAAFTGDAHVARFCQLFYRNPLQFQTLAGRSGSRWARFDASAEVMPSLMYRKTCGRKGRMGDRYVAVNLQNAETVEVRIFRGSLKWHRVLANLELVHAAMAYTRNVSASAMFRDGWQGFAEFLTANTSTYSHLIGLMATNGMGN